MQANTRTYMQAYRERHPHRQAGIHSGWVRHTHTYTYTLIYRQAYTQAGRRAHIHTYIHAHIHTHIEAYMDTSSRLRVTHAY